jgi:hypothetical protein
MAAEPLCLSCGFCCDGSLFTHVTVADPVEQSVLLDAGFQLDDTTTPPRFRQPCAAHRDGCCQIYDQRPTECRRYRCRVLIECESGARAWTDAAALVERAQALRRQALEAWAIVEPETHSATLHALQGRLRERGTMSPLEAAQWAPVLLPLARLQTLLEAHFHRPENPPPR